jgi:hypothetical protein
VISLNKVDKLLESANDKNVLTKKNQSTNDIINQVLEQHKSNAIEAKRIAYLFDAGNAYGTCLNIWNFLKYNVPYVVEPSYRQTTKTLSRMLFDAKRNLGNDCKHYSGFTGAILDALGYKFKYRFTGYSDYIPTPTHVYCVCNEKNDEIVIDAVLSGFNLEKPYKFKIDKKMSLYKLSGVDNENEQIAGINLKNTFKAVKKGVTQATNFAGDKAKQAANYAKVEAARIAKQVVEGTKTIGLALPRNSFLLLVGFNVFNLAGKMKNESYSNLAWWANDWGGDRSKLLEAINVGKNKARILGINPNDIIIPQSMGMIGEPVTIGGSITAAAAILAKIEPYLDKLEKAQQIFDKGKSTFDEGKKQFTEAVDKGKKDFEATTGVKITDVIWKKEAGKTATKNTLDASDVKNTTATDAKNVAEAIVNRATGNGLKIDNKILLIGGVAALAAILLLNKKK